MSRILIIAALLVFASTNLKGQTFFEQLPGPYGGNIYAIELSVTGVPICLSKTKIYRWENSSSSWQVVLTYNHDTNTKKMYRTVGGTLFASATTSGLFRSEDHGQTWIKLDSIGGFSRGISSLPDGTLLHVGKSGFMRSTDNGLSWTVLNSGLTDEILVAVSSLPDGTVFVAAPATGIFRSSDQGSNWELLANSPKDARKLFFSASGHLWAAGEGLWSSSDRGEHWEEAMEGLPTRIRGIAEDDAGNIYVCSNRVNGGIYRSQDNGTTWEVIYDETQRTYWSDLAFDASGTLYVSGDAGVAESTDAGATWEWRNRGLLTTFVKAIVESASGRLFAALEKGGVYSSPDHGRSWEKSWGSSTGETVRALATGPGGVVYAASEEYVYKSTDDGKNWMNLNEGTYFSSCRDVLSGGENTIYCATRKGMAYTGDGGSTWEIRAEGLTATELYCVARLPDGTLFCGIYGEGVFRSTDQGLHWQQSGQELAGTNINALITSGQNTVYAGLYGYGGIYRSTDRGSTWTRIDNGLRNRGVNDLAFAPAGNLLCGSSHWIYMLDPDTDTWIELPEAIIETEKILVDSRSRLIVGTGTDGLFESLAPLATAKLPAPTLTWPANGETKTGTYPEMTWEKVTDAIYYRIQVSEHASMTAPLFDSTFKAREFMRVRNLTSPRQYYWRVATGSTGGLGTWSAIWSFNTGEVVSVKPTSIRSFALHQNYPNPFQPVTTISFSLELPGNVDISVYSLLGTRVAAIANGHFSGGRHSVMFDASDLPDGVYIYRLTTKHGSEIRRLIVLK